MAKRQGDYDELNEEPEELGADGGEVKANEEEKDEVQQDNKVEDENSQPKTAINETMDESKEDLLN